MEWDFEAGGPIVAELSIPAGEIEVDTGDDDRVHVELQVRATGRRLDIGMRGLHLSLGERDGPDDLEGEAEVRFAEGRLAVRVPERPGQHVQAHLRVTLPEGSSVTTRTASAGVRCRSRLARFEATSASGEITLGDVDGDVVVKTASGDVSARTVGGLLRISGASSDVSVERAGGEVDVSLASGDIDLGEAGGPARVKTASGDVRIARARSGRLRLDSASGDVELGVAEGIGAHLDVSSVTGDLTCDLPFQEADATDAALEIVCRTVSGDVHVGAASW